MQSLLDLLRERLDPRTLDEAEFGNLLHVARDENLLPFVAERLSGLGAQLSPASRHQVDEMQRKAKFSSFVWIETLKSTLAAFHADDIPVIALKGPSSPNVFTAIRPSAPALISIFSSATPTLPAPKTS